MLFHVRWQPCEIQSRSTLQEDKKKKDKKKKKKAQLPMPSGRTVRISGCWLGRLLGEEAMPAMLSWSLYTPQDSIGNDVRYGSIRPGIPPTLPRRFGRSLLTPHGPYGRVLGLSLCIVQPSLQLQHRFDLLSTGKKVIGPPSSWLRCENAR